MTFAPPNNVSTAGTSEPTSIAHGRFVPRTVVETPGARETWPTTCESVCSNFAVLVCARALQIDDMAVCNALDSTICNELHSNTIDRTRVSKHTPCRTIMQHSCHTYTNSQVRPWPNNLDKPFMSGFRVKEGCMP
jgi:hypothetical protein